MLARAERYAAQRGLDLDRPPLGAGLHGIVLAAVCQPAEGDSALKVFQRESAYTRERDVYRRLQQNGIVQIEGHHVPQLIAADDELLVVEMSIVTPPYLLDFAGAYLDRPPDFSPEVLADWRAEKEDQFGPHWPHVQRILWSLERLGIFLADIHPSNIAFHRGIP